MDLGFRIVGPRFQPVLPESMLGRRASGGRVETQYRLYFCGRLGLG